jgi:hypothetical protein
MAEQEMTPEVILVKYVTMPDELEVALAGLSESNLDLARAPDAWTIRQIVHHIVDADDITNTIIKAALGKPGCAFGLEWYDPDNTWAKTLDYASQPTAPAIALLRASHRHLEQLLRQLPDAWERYVMIKRFATAEETKLTVGQLIHSQTSHAFHHIEQIRATRQVHGL